MHRIKARLEFKLQDMWIGLFWKTTVKEYCWNGVDQIDSKVIDVWVCIVPCLPLHITYRSI